MRKLHGMVLAAGFGSRLKNLSDQRPKPLLPVCNSPLVTWAAHLLATLGLERISVNLHHLGEAIRETLGENLTLRDPAHTTAIHYSQEHTILGTGGGIRAMADAAEPAETYVVLNGKIVTDVDLGAVLRFHRERRALATMVLYPVPDPQAWGAIGVDEQGYLTRLVEQRRAGRGPGGEYMFTGIHVLSRELVQAIPQESCCVIATAYRELFASGAPLFGYVHRGYFFEHSTPGRYLQGNFNLLTGAVTLPAKPGPLRGVAADAVLGKGVRLHPDTLVGEEAMIGAQAKVGPLSVIGPRARIAEGVALRHSVVWPGVSVDHDLDGCIATPNGVTSVGELGDPWAKRS